METKFTNHVVTLLVRNNCVFDSRVIRAAETLSTAGNDVAVICLHKEGLPTFEIKNNVKYVRIRTRSFKSVLLTYSIIRGIANFVDMLSQKMLPKRKESNIRKSRIEKVIVPERRKKIPIFSLISDFTENSAKLIVYYLRSIYFALPTFVRKQAHGQLIAIYKLLRAPYRLMRAPYRLLRAPYRDTVRRF